MEETKRIRLVFKDEDILSQAQKLEGLNRSWVLLNPETRTVSDLTVHILRVFQLQQTCPNGLILSVSGFALPPHESTHILKDGEIVGVRRKLGSLLIGGNNKTNYVELLEAEARENQTANTGVFLLANEEFEKEKGGYESDEPEEESEEESGEKLPEGTEYQPSTSKDTKKRKRKANEKLQTSKTKKRRAEAEANVANNSDSEKVEKKAKSRPSTKEDAKNNVNDVGNVKSNGKSGASTSGVKRADGVEEQDKDTEDAETVPKEIVKRPSRSARRKYAKRKWLREMAKIQKQNATCTSESLRNWYEDKAKAEGTNSNDEIKGSERKKSNGQLKRPQMWKKRGMDPEKNEDDDQPKGLLHWKQSPQGNFVKGKKHPKRKENDSFHRKLYQNGDGFEQPSESHDDIPEKPTQKDAHSQEHENNNADTSKKDSDKETEIVPIVVKPGHIRFEPLEEGTAFGLSRFAHQCPC